MIYLVLNFKTKPSNAGHAFGKLLPPRSRSVVFFRPELACRLQFLSKKPQTTLNYTMDLTAKTLQNNALLKNVPRSISQAIQTASARVGVDFSYMVEQAAAESNFRPEIKAKTSSATGLYQFIESTWMGMMDQFADKHGIETAGKSKSEILEMRKDPEIASLMAAELASQNASVLESRWAKGEKDIGSTELYFAHFMGAGGASAFMNAHDKNPTMEAAILFPKAANANKNVFYDSATGKPRSLEQVYAFFDKKFSGNEVNQIAVSTPLPPSTTVAPKSMDTNMSEALAIYTPKPPKPSDSVIFNAQPKVPTQTQEYTDPSYFMASLLSGLKSGGGAYGMVSSPVEIMLMAQMDMKLPL